MLVASLGSGSRGNATLIEAGRTALLIDCGFGIREMDRRLGRLHRSPVDLSGVLITHEHGDHARGVARLAARYRLDVWATQGTVAAARLEGLEGIRVFERDKPFAIGDFEIHPFAVPHDAREPCQFVLGDGVRRLGVLSDTGSITPGIAANLSGCDALLIECNHEERMLSAGPYPPSLKMRILGEHGHLSNAQAAALLGRIAHDRLQHVVAVHLSDRNNHPALARRALARALGCEPSWIGIADQDAGLGWREVM